MKIAITTSGDNISDKVDQRFGRCKSFFVFDIKKDENKSIEEKKYDNFDFKKIENQGAIQGHGAGIKAAEQMGLLAIDVIITGNIGPNATDILSQLDIKRYRGAGEIKSVLIDFLNDKLEEINDIAEAHSGSNKEKKEEEKESDNLKERIFFPLLDNKGLDSEISSHFGHAPLFGLYNTETKELEIKENDLDHSDPTKSPVDQIIESVNPTTVFALGIGGRAIGLFNERNIKLKTGDYKYVKEVIENIDSLYEQKQSCGH